MNNVKDEYNVDDNVLLVFHYKQYGWYGTEVLRYNDLREAKDDLRIVARYGVDSNNLSDKEGNFKLYDDYMRNVENNEKPRFSLEGNRESFQVEIVPFNKVAGNKEYLDKLSVIHFIGKDYDFSNKFYNNFESAKKDFFGLADQKIDEEVNKGLMSKHDASISRITLDEYKRLGKYKWGYKKDDGFQSFTLHQYKIKDLRNDKTKYLDGQNPSIFLNIIESYRRGERFFMTENEWKLASDEDRMLKGFNVNIPKSVKSLTYDRHFPFPNRELGKEKKKIQMVYKVHHRVRGDDYDAKDTKEVLTYEEAIRVMKKRMLEDFERYDLPKNKRKEVFEAFILSMGDKPVRYGFKIPADDNHGDIVVKCVLEEGHKMAFAQVQVRVNVKSSEKVQEKKKEKDMMPKIYYTETEKKKDKGLKR